MTRSFNPVDDAEGEAFVAAFCDRCRRDAGMHPCGILLRGASLDGADPDFPPEWVRDEAGRGTCTAFLPLGRHGGAVVILAEEGTP